MTTPGFDQPAERLRIEETEHALLISVGGARPAIANVARSIPAEPGRLCVVAADAGLVYHPELVHRLRHWVPARYEGVRLIAPFAGLAGQSGRIPAQELSNALDADVVAPDGEFVAVPGGLIFVLGVHRPGGGQFLRFRPGRAPMPAGRRFPAPDWERELLDLPDPSIPEVIVDEIPAGLWVRWSSDRAFSPDDLAFAIPVKPEGPALVVSRPGDPPMRAADLRRVMEVIPAVLHERLIATPYGDNPLADGELGAVVSAAANRTLRVRTGLSLHLAGRGRQVVAIDQAGEPAWTPFAQEVAWRPHGGGRVLSWLAPADQLLPAGNAQLMLNERWVVEIVEAGLWLRPVDRNEGAAIVRRLPITAGRCTVVIGVDEPDQPQPPWRSTEKLLSRLPPEALTRLCLAVPAGAGDWFADAVAKGCRGILGGRHPELVTATGLVGIRDEPQPMPARQQPVAPVALVRSPRHRADEAGALLQFVDQIRRTPAWDEIPDPVVVAASALARAEESQQERTS